MNGFLWTLAGDDEADRNCAHGIQATPSPLRASMRVGMRVLGMLECVPGIWNRRQKVPARPAPPGPSVSRALGAGARGCRSVK